MCGLMARVAVGKIVVNIITFITCEGINHLCDRAKSANLMNNACKKLNQLLENS